LMAMTAASLSPIASSRESRRANASDDDNEVEAFTVVDVIIVMADEQRRWWPSIADRWDLTIALLPSSKICREDTRTTRMTSPPPYNSLPSERRGTKDATTAAPTPPPIPPVTLMPAPSGD
jgi:hypothetical protein